MSQNNSETSEGVFEQESLTEEERSALYATWFDVSLDIDRHLLTLSLACLGVLATLLAGNVLKTKLQFIIWIAACVFFIIEIAVLLIVVFLNKKQLTVTLEKNRPQQDRCLYIFEIISRGVFFVALLITTTLMGAVAFEKFESVDSVEKSYERQNQETGTGIQWPRYRGGRSFWDEPDSARSRSAYVSDRWAFKYAEVYGKTRSRDSNVANETGTNTNTDREEVSSFYRDNYR